ncbi:unnamed protein product [Peronospora belbahrii]|uniref:GPI inositol-deacylase n=1 Tax=Peronospora belbahrii TaxID=622444 RepID=A0ABN8D1M0_9STRA|nr:unnamed protein product [Peronospora belbahrii]
MQVHGLSTFSVLATPNVALKDTASVLYDAFATFKEDNMMYKYALVDGVAYVSRSLQENGMDIVVVECSHADILSSINLMVQALGEAEAVSTITTSDGSVVPCTSNESFKILVNGIKYGVCFYGPSGFTMFGSDIDVKVEYVTNHLPSQAPRIARKTKKSCKKVASPTSITPIGKSFLTGESIYNGERSLNILEKIILGGSCQCQSTPRPCIFIHGLGILVEKEENLDSFSSYWGNQTDHAPCCSSTEYAMLNTVNNSWADQFQQQKVCDRMLAVSETSKDSEVSDTIIISHSMGSLMIAGAIANSQCKLASSTTWIAIGSPMLGSMASDYFQESCKDQTNFIMEEYVDSTRLCPADDGIKSLAYENESYSNPTLNKLYQSAQKAYRNNVYAAMCSHSYLGLLSSYQAKFWVLGTMIPHKTKHSDGIVEFLSCAGGFPETKFHKTYTERFYTSRLNHHDMAFRAGDALFDKSRMPVKWFQCLL